MAMMVALGSAVSGLKSEQTALDVIANNIANVNTTGYKSQTVTFSDLLSQTISSSSSSTATTASVNSQQVGLGVAIASTTTDMTVGSTSTTSNSTDVALSGAGYFIVGSGTAGDYSFSRAGNLSVDDSGNLNINGNEVYGWESYTLDTDGNKVYDTSGAIEAINLTSDTYSGSKSVMAAKATTSASFTGALDSSSTVAAGATGLTSIGDTTALTYDTTSEITAYDAQGNDYAVKINWKKCAVEGDTTSWYWEAASTTSGVTITPSSGYVAFDSDGKIVTSATTLSATVDDTAGYTSSNVALSSGVAAGTYALKVTGTSGDYTLALTDSNNTTWINTSTKTDGTATFTDAAGDTITLTAPTSISTGTSNFTVTAASTTTTAASATVSGTSASGYTSTDITATSVPAGTYTVTVAADTSTPVKYTVTLKDSSGNSYTDTTSATNGSASFTLGTGETLNLDIPSGTIAAGTTSIVVTAASTSTTAASVKDTEANYAYSDIAVGTGVTAGNYTINVTGTSGAYTVTLSDGTTTYNSTTTAKDGSATFTTSSGTITLSVPKNLEAGSTEFSVASTTSAFDSKPTITVATPASAGTADLSVALDFSALTSTDVSSSTATGDADGYTSGTLKSYTISTDGTIVGTYSNTKTQSMGQIALAVFDNASGLTKTGDNLYTISGSSGNYQTVVAGTNGTGTMTAYALELSNVDLASQFSSMMIAQRAYQANSKVITTGDEMLQYLMSMKN